jgi:hypothetical protein
VEQHHGLLAHHQVVEALVVESTMTGQLADIEVGGTAKDIHCFDADHAAPR